MLLKICFGALYYCTHCSKNAALLLIQHVLQSDCSGMLSKLVTYEMKSQSKSVSLLGKILMGSEWMVLTFSSSAKTFLVSVLSLFARTSWNHRRRIKCVSSWSSHSPVKRQQWAVCPRMTGSWMLQQTTSSKILNFIYERALKDHWTERS